MEILVLSSTGFFVTLYFEASNITALIGLYVPDNEYIMVDTVNNNLFERVITSTEGEEL